MNIETIKACSYADVGKKVRFVALLTKNECRQKSNGADYAHLTFQDETGMISFPHWSANAPHTYEEGTVYTVNGSISMYEDEVQIKVVTIEELENSNPADFVPRYDTRIVEEYIVATIDNLPDKYKEVAMKMTGYRIDPLRWEKFRTCPAAVKHHHNKVGGLMLHTAGVIKTVVSIADNYNTGALSTFVENKINKPRLVFKALIHDVEKMREYSCNGAIQHTGTSINHRVAGVAALMEKSVGILSDEELDNIAYSILCHHGDFGEFKIKSTEDYLLHLADMIDSRVFSQD